MDDSYSAAKTRSGRPGWSVIFRHPLRTDVRSRPGLKIRRGLNTTDEAKADELVGQLNTLLSDRTWWSVDRRADAERMFAPQVVAAFFDGLETGPAQSASLRDRHIRLPSRDEGYTRVLLVGTTGAGKTTLLRHLIGSSHQRDRFPSTSTAKTTIADTEIVIAEGVYTAAITFMSEFEVRAHIEECIEAACLAAVDDPQDPKIAAALLTHREQRFRLSYLLGEWSEGAPAEDDEFQFEETDTNAADEVEGVADDERAANKERVAGYIARIKAMTADIVEKNRAKNGSYGERESPDEKAAWLELFTDRLFDCEDFAQLALDIRDEVEAKFALLEGGELDRSPGGWPLIWTFESANREAFIQQVRWFAGNHHKQFGRLLTPLVDGVRVRGPFRPRRRELQDTAKLVLLDGQGLGHTAQSVSSVSTKITKRFADADLILLVDSALQPMQAGPLALLRATGSAGYAEKVALTFTYFDQVKGDNLQTTSQKRAHLLASTVNALAGLRETLGAPVAAALDRRLEDCTFIFGALNREIDDIPSGVVKEMRRLLQLMRGAAEPEVIAEAAPVYEVGGLELALRDAVDAFLRPWEARLGLTYRDGIRAEHWTRIRALSRRFANAWGDEFDTLRPAGDLISRLQEEISRWLDSPASWTRPPRDDDERMAALNPVRSTVFTALHDLVRKRLADQHRQDWIDAYGHSGYGSGAKRAGDIRRIYEDSAPPISSAMKPEARAFLAEVLGIVRTGVEAAGGRFEPPRAA